MKKIKNVLITTMLLVTFMLAGCGAEKSDGEEGNMSTNNTDNAEDTAKDGEKITEEKPSVYNNFPTIHADFRTLISFAWGIIITW